MALHVLLFVATLVGIVVQSTVGFGFAFFVAPVAVALLDPEQAVTLLLILGTAINALVLAGERRHPQIDRRALAVLLVAALPGLVAGVAIVNAVSAATLQIVIGVLILVGALFQARSDQVEVETARRRPHLVAAGASAGVLTTATSLNGPAVVLGLLSLGWRGARLRDGIAAALLGLNALGAIALIALGGAGRALPPLWLLAVCVPLVVVGHRIGAALFRGLGEGGHRRAVIVASVFAGIASLLAGLL